MRARATAWFCLPLLALELAACQKPVKRQAPAVSPEVVGLIAQLQQPDQLTQRAALRSLSELGQRGKSAIPAVTAALQRAHGSLRGEAAITLVALDPSGKQALPGVRAALADDAAEARELGAIAVGLLGEAGKPAYQQVDGLTADGSPEVRAAAVYATLKLQPSKPNVERAYAAIEGGDPRGRFMGLRGLRELGPGSVGELYPIIAAIDDPNVGTAVEAIRIVESLAERGVAAKAALLAALERDAVSERASQALAAIDPTGEALVPALSQCVQRCASPQARARALDGLGNYPARVDDTLPALLLALQDKDLRVVSSALRVVARLKPSYRAIGSSLALLASDGPSALAWKASEVMAGYTEAVDDFSALARGPKRARLRAAYGLGRLSKTPAVRSTLEALRADPEAEVRQQVELALRNDERGSPEAR